MFIHLFRFCFSLHSLHSSSTIVYRFIRLGLGSPIRLGLGSPTRLGLGSPTILGFGSPTRLG